MKATMKDLRGALLVGVLGLELVGLACWTGARLTAGAGAVLLVVALALLPLTGRGRWGALDWTDMPAWLWRRAIGVSQLGVALLWLGEVVMRAAEAAADAQYAEAGKLVMPEYGPGLVLSWGGGMLLLGLAVYLVRRVVRRHQGGRQ